MPKRAESSAEVLIIEAHQCVVMGGKTLPVAVPTIQECGVTCVALNSCDHWLNKIVGNRCRGDPSLVVKEFVDGVLDALQSEPSGEAPSNPTAAAGQGASPVKVVGTKRDVFGFNADSDEEELAARSIKPGKKARVPKGGAKLRSELKTVKFRGLEITVKKRDKGRGLAVPLEGETLLTILKHLRSSKEKGVPSSDSPKKARREENLGNREDEDAGRLCWVFKQTGYSIFYVDDEGKQHRLSDGLKVSRHDHLGQRLSVEAFKEARDVALSKARALWNRLDKSDSQRYEIATVEG